MNPNARKLLASPGWKKLEGAGAMPQRMLWASTGTKDPNAPDAMYLEALAAPDTIDTIPEKTLKAFADHGKVDGVMDVNGGDAEEVIAKFARAGIDVDAVAEQLQREGGETFSKSWNDLMDRIASKSEVLKKAGNA